MPEMHFRVRWPDGRQEVCYSPSLVIQQYFVPGKSYPLSDFVAKSRAALMVASERVRALHGFPCSLALGQIGRIEAGAKSQDPAGTVLIEAFEE